MGGAGGGGTLRQRLWRVSVAFAVGAALVAIPGCGDDDGGGEEAATLSVERVGGRPAPAVEVQRVSAPPPLALPGVEPRSPIYRVTAEGPMRLPVLLRFHLADESDVEGRRFVVASRERPGEAWTLEPAEVDGAAVVLRRDDLSFFGLFEATEEVFAGAGRKGEELLGVRAPPPRCSRAGASYELGIDGGGGRPLVSACPDRVDGRPALRVANLRAVGLEFQIPSGAHLEQVSAPSLGEATWQSVEHSLERDGVQLLPGGGSLTVVFGDPGLSSGAQVRFEGTWKAAATDLALRSASFGSARLGSFLTAVQCTWGLAPKGPFLNDPLATLLGDCGLPVVGDVKLTRELYDAIRTNLGKPTTVRIRERPARLPPVASAPRREPFLVDVTPTGEIRAIGAFDPLQYLGEGPIAVGAGVEPILANAIAAFGRPASLRVEYQASGCIARWPGQRLRATAYDFGGGEECAPTAGVQTLTAGYLALTDMRRDPLAERWRTNRGLRVGDSQRHLERLYPNAFIPPRAEHTFVLATQPSIIGSYGYVERLQANVYDGVVIGLTVSPYGAGE